MMGDEGEKSATSLDKLLKFLGGLAGLLALGSAFLSAAGFFVLRSNANLLGLSNFLHHSLSDYFYVGGAFLIDSFFLAGAALLSIGGVVKWAVIASITLYLVLKRFRRTASLVQRILTRARTIFREPLVGWACILFGVYLLYKCLQITAPTGITSNLLFIDGNPEELYKHGTEASLQNLKAYYEKQLLCLIISGIVVWVITIILRSPGRESGVVVRTSWWSSSKQDDKNNKTSAFIGIIDNVQPEGTNIESSAPNTPVIFFAIGKMLLYILLMVELMLIPISYGQNIYSNEFHKVCLTLNTNIQSTFPRSDNLWLIREDTNSFSIYYGDYQEIRIIPKKDILDISIHKRVNIFSPQDPKEDQMKCRPDAS